MNNLLVIAIFGVVLRGTKGSAVFSNPILNMPTSDDGIVLSWDQADTIYHAGSSYYLVGVNNNVTFVDEASYIVIRQSPFLTDFNNATISIPFKAPIGDFLESTVMQKVNGSLYLYFTRFHGDCPSFKIYVMIADNPNNPMGAWSSPKPLFVLETEYFQMYGSVMEHDSQFYWVGTEIDTNISDPIRNVNNLIVYKMKSPMEITDKGTVLGDNSWDCFQFYTGCFVFNPHIVHNMGVNYVVYSTTSSKNTSLSFISISEEKDPLNSSNWIPPPGLVFTGNEAEDVYMIRTASFTKSPDGSETWMVYHATSEEEGYGLFRPRIEQIKWNPGSGEPEFPVAHGYSHPQSKPSGEV